jgi:hypothetical protein
MRPSRPGRGGIPSVDVSIYASGVRLFGMADQAWLQPVITSVATLTGAALGATGTYLAQRGVWSKQYDARWDEVRRVAYGKILSVANRYHDAKARGESDQLGALADEYLQVTGEASLLMNDPTRNAARDLLDYISDLPTQPLGSKVDEREFREYLKFRDAFRQAARNEIKIS